MAYGIWNLTNDWSPESKSHHQRLEFSAWNPESMKWNLNPTQSWIPLHLSGVRPWQEKYFSALQLPASVSPWKLTLSPGHRVFVFLISTLFLQLHHEVSCQSSMLLVAMLIVCIIYRKWSNGRTRADYLILRVQDGSESQHRCQNPRLRSFLSSIVFPNFDHNIEQDTIC